MDPDRSIDMKCLHKYLTITLALASLILLPTSLLAGECMAPEWIEAVQYVRGDIVTYDKNEGRAKRTSFCMILGFHKSILANP